MRRWVAVLLLVVVATFMAVQGLGRCHGHMNAHHEHPQHVLCLDDCAQALIPLPPNPPPADRMIRVVYKETVVRPILTLDLEPEKEPPRA